MLAGCVSIEGLYISNKLIQKELYVTITVDVLLYVEDAS